MLKNKFSFKKNSIDLRLNVLENRLCQIPPQCSLAMRALSKMSLKANYSANASAFKTQRTLQPQEK